MPTQSMETIFLIKEPKTNSCLPDLQARFESWFQEIQVGLVIYCINHLTNFKPRHSHIAVLWPCVLDFTCSPDFQRALCLGRRGLQLFQITAVWT